MSIYRVTRVWDVEAKTSSEALDLAEANGDLIEEEADLIEEDIDKPVDEEPRGMGHDQHDTWEEHRGER
jgi:hypothetical protein